MKIAWPSLLLRLSVIGMLLRCRFWEIESHAVAALESVVEQGSGGCSIFDHLARPQVGELAHGRRSGTMRR